MASRCMVVPLPDVHPWTVPREDDDDGPPDTGDPRDMTVPSVRRGGMTPADPEAWAREINTIGDEHPGSEPGDWVDAQAADEFGAYAEALIREEPRRPAEAAFARTLITVPIDGMVARAPTLLRDHWIYGTRFWAWWQNQATRSTPCNCDHCGRLWLDKPTAPKRWIEMSGTQARALGIPLRDLATLSYGGEQMRVWKMEAHIARDLLYLLVEPVTASLREGVNAHGIDTAAIRRGDYIKERNARWHLVESVEGSTFTARWSNGLRGIEKLADVTEHRACPRIALPDGREVAAKRMWRDGPMGWANADGRGWFLAYETWCEHLRPYTDDDQITEHRVWPPLDVEPAA